MKTTIMSKHLNCRRNDHNCKQNVSGNIKFNGAGQSMQIKNRRRSANWLQQLTLILALAIFPTWAFALSDLVMTGDIHSTTSVINTNGGSLSIANTIRNQGEEGVLTAVRVGFYLSTDNVITTEDTFLGSRTVAATALVAGTFGSSTSGGTSVTVPAGLAPGTYYIGAIADDNGLEAESDETNNAKLGTTLTITRSDLVITGVSSTTSLISTRGGTIFMADTLKNQGIVATTTAIRVGYYLSTDNIITTADTFLGYRTSSNAIAAGASSNQGANVAVPAGLLPGNYYLGAIADYNELEAETDETNNVLASTGSTFKIAQADLLMIAVSSTTPYGASGSRISIANTLKNQGPVNYISSVRAGYYLSDDNLITTSDTLLGYRSVCCLSAGKSSVGSGSALYGTIPTGLAPGAYYIGAIADDTGLETESDETNNALVGPMIGIGPDFVMTAISTTSTAAILGNTITVADTLANQGVAATTSGCRLIGYYLSSDTTITTTDTLIGSRQQCGVLAGNRTNSVAALNVTIPVGAAIGTYYLGAIADYTDAEPEAYETNNSLSSTATILLANLPAAPTNVNATGAHTKATVTFNATTNDGGSAITGYTVTSSPAGGVDSYAGSTGLSHVITGLTNGVTYTFTVKATSIVGTGSASAASNSITPAPTAPDAPDNAAAVSGHTKATVSFTAPEANGSAITGYTVISSPAGGVDGNAGSIGLNHVVRGLVNGTAYTFTVTATNAVGTSAASQPSNSIIPAPTAPDAPDNARAAGGDSQARVTFNTPPENGSPISIYTATSNPGGITASGAGSPITVTGLTNGAAYSFTVTATNGIGTSDPSQPSNSIVAMVLPEMFYVHSDHLSTPRQITDTAGNVVWDWQNSDPFGSNMPNENPSGQGAFENPLRFPGQYADKETNTYYNVNRDYDPAIGRYVQSDPIGLEGGINTYTYVGGNPIRRVDPSGLDWIYQQPTGQMYYQPPASAGGGPPAPIGAPGYSGNGLGLNSFEYENVPFIGPIPEGTYQIGPAYHHEILGNMTMNLTPINGTNTWGRDLFRIHGDNGDDDYSASQGCVVSGKNIRKRISESPDRILRVIF